MASYRRYTKLISKRDNLSVNFRDNLKQYRKDVSYIDSHKDLYANLGSFESYSKYVNTKKYNTALFFSLLMKIFVTLAPLIIISVILQKDNFKFDFFVFVNRFANLQLNFSQPIIDFIKNSREFASNNFTIVLGSANGLEWLVNIGRVLANIGVIIVQFFSVIALVFTFILDFFGNVVAFINALVPNLF